MRAFTRHSTNRSGALPKLLLAILILSLCFSVWFSSSFATKKRGAKGVARSLDKKQKPVQKALRKSALRKRCGKVCQPRLSRLSSVRVTRLLRQLRKQKFSYSQRLLLLSEMFLGTRYKLGPLGEGPKGRWDRDPTWRLDAVDCVTYVETVMALAGSTSLSNARKLMQRIRYKDGDIRFVTRNHFTAAQWLPVNAQAGYLKPISKRVGGKWGVALRRQITPAMWRQRTWRWWRRRLPQKHRPKSYTIWYIPLRHIAKIQHKLPSVGWMGEIFDRPGYPISVRHVGMIVKKHGKVLFRHANRPRVQEIGLVRYARRHMWLRKRKRSRVVGFSFAAFSVPKHAAK